ncbi:hypothetical protein JW905_14795 [bacterium]|nr:hypothetical protein [candidate division CSSED10-310 bacterium]
MKGITTRKLLAMTIVVLAVVVFGSAQYYGMDRAAALVYDLGRGFAKTGAGSVPGEVFSHRAEMTVNGRLLHLSYSTCQETVPRILEQVMQALPQDGKIRFWNIRDVGGVVAYEADGLLTIVSASWDPPTGSSLITRGWTEFEPDGMLADLAAPLSRELGEIVEARGGELAELAGHLAVGCDIGQFLNAQVALINSDPQLAAAFQSIRGMTASVRRDAPGADLDQVPRPPASTRLVSMEQNLPSGGRMAMVSYQAASDLAAVDNFYVHAMGAAGWRSDRVFDNVSTQAAAEKKYLFTRAQATCSLAIKKDVGASDTRVTILYLDKIL